MIGAKNSNRPETSTSKASYRVTISEFKQTDIKENILGTIVTNQLPGIGYLEGVTHEHDRSQQPSRNS
jgi:hypothetical protein